MPNVVATHAVGNLETWLAGAQERTELFKSFSSGHQVFVHTDGGSVLLLLENVDMAKFAAVMQDPATDDAKARHTVIEPVQVFVHKEGAR